MRKVVMRAAAAVATGVALGGLVVSGAGAAGAAAQARGRAAWLRGPAGPAGPAAAGGRLWVARYRGPGRAENIPAKAAVSPDGKTVYVTGQSAGTVSNYDWATIAYRAATGARLWVSRYNGPGNGSDVATSLAVSPDGRRLYVTGWSAGASAADGDSATIAYSAATGARLWVARSGGGGAAVAVSPDGRRVYVAGRGSATSSGHDLATAAFSAATGARLWARRYRGPGRGFDAAASLAVSPGGRVYVSGESQGTTSGADYVTAAYSPAGARLWLMRYNGPGNGYDSATSVAAPGNGRVYVTGDSAGKTSGVDFATIAYDAATGARLWIRRYDGPGHGSDYGPSLAVSPAGTVIVTGNSGSGQATIAYGSRGARLWAGRYGGAEGRIVAVPGNGRVYVSGTGYRRASGEDFVTIARNVFSGAVLWIRRYSGPGTGGNNADGPVSMAARAGRVFVTGMSCAAGTAGSFEYATVAYAG